MDDDRIMALFGRIMDKLERMDDRLTAHDQRFDAVDARFDAIDARFDAMDTRFDKVDAQQEGLRDDMQVTMGASNETDRRRRADRAEIDGLGELLGRAMQQILKLRADVDALQRRQH